MFLALVPAYNEERHIDSVVRSLFDHVDRVVVIDDGSSDRTALLARDAGAVVVAHAINRGQGAALQTGHAYALDSGARFVLHFDADNQFDVHDITPAFEKMKIMNADVVFGSRFLDTRSRIPWFKRSVLLPLARLFDRSFSRVRLTDAHNGFRILNRKALEAVVISQERMAHASEIPHLVQKHHLSYIEYPVRVTYHEYGQSLFGGFHIFKDVILGLFTK